MKNLLKTISILILLLLTGFSVKAQTQAIRVANTGTVSTNTNELPISFASATGSSATHKRGQTVYPPAMLEAMIGSRITKMTFYRNASGGGYSGNNNVKVSAVCTTANASSAFIINGLTEVYSGPISVTDAGSGAGNFRYTLVITLDNPFLYTGNNLLLDMNNTIKQGNTSTSSYRTVAQTNGGRSVTSATSANSPPTTGGTVRGYLPTVMFEFTPDGTGHNIAVTVNGSGSVTIGETAITTGTTWKFGTGAMPTYVITPATNHRIATVMLNGSDITGQLTGTGNNREYRFAALTADQDLVITFEELPKYTITASSEGSGTISSAGSAEYHQGTSPVFTMTPATNHIVEEVWVNGNLVTPAGTGAVKTYTFSNIQGPGPYTIHAVFMELPKYTITASSEGNGTISSAGSAEYHEGTSPLFTMTPDEFHKVGEVRVNGNIITPAGTGAVKTYTFTNLQGPGPYTIHVTFIDLPLYTITASHGENGTISPVGTDEYYEATSPVFTITPNPDYTIRTIFINGAAITSTANTHTFTNLQGPQTIHVTFIAKLSLYANGEATKKEVPLNLECQGRQQDNMMASWAEGQVLYPAADLASMIGSEITKMTFYRTGSGGACSPGTVVILGTVSGMNLAGGKINTSEMTTVRGVSTSTTIPVTNNTLVITFTTPFLYMGGDLVVYMENQTRAGTPSSHEYLGIETSTKTGWWGNKWNDYTDPYDATESFNFLPRVDFEYLPTTLPTQIITALPPENGTILPAGETAIPEGKEPVYIIIPDPFYMIDKVFVDGMDMTDDVNINIVTEVGSYTFLPVTGPHTIEATFKPLPKYTITATAGKGGSISFPGTEEYWQGESPTYTFTPEPGYKVFEVYVSNTYVGKSSTYTFPLIRRNYDIHVEFVVDHTRRINVGTASNSTIRGEVPIQVQNNILFTGYQNNQMLYRENLDLDGMPEGSQITRVIFYRSPTDGCASSRFGENSVKISFLQTTRSSMAGGLEPLPPGTPEYRRVLVVVNRVLQWDFEEFGEEPVIYNGDNLLINIEAQGTQYDWEWCGTPGWNTYFQNFTRSNASWTKQLGISAWDEPVDAVLNHIPRITIEYTPPLVTIMATAGDNGDIDPEGRVVIVKGEDQTFTITPDPGYEIDTVWVNGEPVTLTDSTYTFTNLEEDATISVTFKAIVYSITYYNEEGATNDNPLSYTIETLVTLENLERTGYAFEGWFNNAEGVGTREYSIPLGTIGNKEFWAKWRLETYNITYFNHHNVYNPNPDEYNITQTPITLDSVERLGYHFTGWYDNVDYEGEAITEIPEGSAGNLFFWANWEIIIYTIIYHNVEDAVNPNPDNYDVETTVILENPTLNGYEFDGWYEDEDFELPVSQIAVGTTGTLEFWAKWSLITYTITYHNDKDIESDNPKTYTIEDTPISLDGLTADGYEFDGWYENEEDETAVTEIAERSYGDKEFWAKWTAIPYNITYHNDKNAVSDNPDTYTIDDTPLTLDDLTVNGYRFDGWYENEEDEEAVTEIPEGSYGEKEFWAKWSIITYNIIYHHVNDADNSNNPDTYTIETPTIVLADLIGGSSEFQGWFGYANLSGTPVTEIPEGSYGDKEFWAKWNTGITDPVMQNVHIYSYMNMVYIVNRDHIPLKSVEIIDMLGRTVYHSTSVQSPISLNIADGQYIVRLISNDVVLNTKIVIGN